MEWAKFLVIEAIKKARDRCPYPLDIFVSKEQEGKIGRHCHSVWNNALNEFFKIMKEMEEDDEKSKENIVEGYS